MKKESPWPDTLLVIVILIVLGWIISSIAGCEAKTNEAQFHFMGQNTTGTIIW